MAAQLLAVALLHEDEVVVRVSVVQRLHRPEAVLAERLEPRFQTSATVPSMSTPGSETCMSCALK